MKAQDDPLRESGDPGAVDKGVIPKRLVFGVPVAELEGDTSENQRQQHDRQWKIDRRHDDREGQRKDG
jgi:hypothetical protein